MQHVSDSDRKNLAAALAAALTLIYAARARQALDKLGHAEDELTLSAATTAKIAAYAAARAAQVQEGINRRLETAGTQDDPGQAVQQSAREIADYNRSILTPSVVSWASHQGLIDTYRETLAPDGSGQSALDANQWTWQQLGSFPDDCSSAAAASPASYDTLVGIAGSPPPCHRGCNCDLSPA